MNEGDEVHSTSGLLLGRWCELCQTPHSASCYHPSRMIIADLEAENKQLSDGLAAAQVFAIELKAALIAEIAELNKYLKHARDDKKIRLGEIQELGEKIIELGNAIDHLQGQCNRLREALASKET